MVVASLSDDGDLNFGVSVGSVSVAVILVLGLLPFTADAFYLGLIDLRIASITVIAALLICLWLIADNELIRTDVGSLVLA
jgi:hypothetical protein